MYYYILTYIARYVARKGNRFSKNIINNKKVICEECLKTLVLQPNDVIPKRHKLIEIKIKGYLKNPCVALFNLFSSLEKGAIEATKDGEINVNTLFEIMELIDEEKNPITLIVVKDLRNNYEFTKNIIRLYLITQMYFLVKQANRNDNAEREKIKEQRKSLKLVHLNNTDIGSQMNEANANDTIIQMRTNRKKDIKLEAMKIEEEGIKFTLFVEKKE